MKKEYLLEGLCCGNCARKIENAAKAMGGVESARVDLKSTTLALEVKEESQNLLDNVRRLVGEIEKGIQVSEKPAKRGLFKAWR